MTDLRVSADGWLAFDGRRFRCALGHGGIVRAKMEGDGATPSGRVPLREAMFRPDRVAPPATRLATRPIAPEDGWCDDPSHADYNRGVRLPHPARCERLWRADRLYDLVVVLGYNDAPPVPGRGSAIFLHVAGAGYPPTQGCVALALGDLETVLSSVGPGDALQVTAAVL
jgi:L,D-peptidoglycan transpeptidase YkuD (ErfK/YbiS/YcfS/YnhG family)